MTTERIELISRRIFWSCILFAILAGSNSALLTFYELRSSWLEITGSLLGGIALLLLVVSWLTPVTLLLVGVPWLAHAWLRGMNPIAVSSTPWAQMSLGEKASIYFYSLLIGVAVIFATIAFVIFTIRK